MRELIGANWLILTPIVLLSVVSLTIIIERARYFLGIRQVNGDLLSGQLEMIGRYPAQHILSAVEDFRNSPAVVLLNYGLTTRIRAVPGMYKQRMEALKDRQLDRMERHLSLLPAIGNIATLMGLFGTVSGMITTFSRMTEAGSSDPYVLAGGISRALVTTAAGLAVAIPTLIAHHFLDTLIDRHAEQMEEVLSECLSQSGVSNARKREPQTPQGK